MKKYLVTTLVLIVVGLGVAWLLLPRQQQVALMNLKDKRFDSALRSYEQQLESGDMSIAVVMPLADLYLQHADVDAAINLMERFVERNPDNIQARKQLGIYYQYAQRPDDYLRNLEEMQRIRPSAETLKELSDIYNFKAEYDKQITVLEQLVEVAPENPENFVMLATMQASYQRLSDANATLQKLAELHPNYADRTTLELMLSIAMDAGELDSVMPRVKAWLDANPNMEARTSFANTLEERGYSAQAFELLGEFDPKLAEEQPLYLLTYAGLLTQTGKQNQAYELLNTRYEAGTLPRGGYQPYLSLLLDRGEYSKARKVVEEVDLEEFSPDTLIYLTEVAIDNPKSGLAARIKQGVSHEFRQQHPYFDTVLMMANRESGTVARAERLRQQIELSVFQQLRLARLGAKAGYDALALSLIKELAPYKDVPEQSLVDLSEIYIRLGRAKEGFAEFDALRQERSTPAIETAWVRLAASAGKADIVEQWLANKTDDEISDRLLADLYFLASDQKQYSLALASAQRLYNVQKNNQTRLYMGTALFYNGRYDEAIEFLRDIRKDSDAAADMYIAALSKMAKKDPKYREELITLLTARLEDPNVSRKSKQDMVYTLLDYGETATLLPHIRQYAKNEGGSWTALYEESLQKLGKKKELLNFRLERALSKGTPTKERRELAFYLLENGHKKEAESIFLQLASQPTPNPDDVEQLLHLWGPRPSAENVDRLYNWAASSKGKTQEKWLKHLVYVGAPEKALNIIESQGMANNIANRDALFDIYLDAMQRSHRHDGLAAAINKRAEIETDPERLRKLASLAVQEGQLDTATALYQHILKISPDDKEALRNLGASAFAESAYSLSKQYFSRYFDLGYSDYESNFYYGELMWREEKYDVAKLYYRNAQEKIEQSTAPTPTMRAVEAQILYRLGDKEQSFALFRDLLTTRPKDRGLRADFIAVLLENFVFEEARNLLGNS